MRSPTTDPRQSDAATAFASALARVVAGGIACVGLVACQPYRIEYHQRPEFYRQASEEELPDEWVAPDGTIVKFSSAPLPSEQEAMAAQAENRKREVDRDGDGKPDEVEPTPTWEEKEDGTVTMRAFLPADVIGNFMQSLRDERYGEFYDQMLASATRDAFAARSEGQGKKAFAAWCVKYRRRLMESLNRMGFGYLSPDVVLRKTGSNSFRVGFTPRVAEQFKFTTLDFVYENGGCRLLKIQ
ncbi:MAG: hypothetical protein U0572_18360 [Phycisphaerales bacterium]